MRRSDARARQMSHCTIPGCARPQRARGWCTGHYERWRRHGDPRAGDPLIRVADTPEESFAARTERRGSCLVWTGTIADNGYGEIWDGARAVKAHRYAWERVNGPVPEGKFLDHACFTHACVDIRHLRLATKSQNGANRASARSASRTGFRNVRPEGNRFVVVITKDGEVGRYGTFATVEEAARAAESTRRELFGDFAGATLPLASSTRPQMIRGRAEMIPHRFDA